MHFSPRYFRSALHSLVLFAASLVLTHAQSSASPQTAPAQSAPSAQTAASAHLDQVLSTQSRARTIAQVAVSPNGQQIAWLESGQIRVAPIDDFAHSQPVTAAGPGHSCNSSDLVWSPDSASLAFLSDCDAPGQPDLFLSHLDGSPAHRITQLHGFVDAPAFSPDGTRIAFLYVEGATRPAGALAAEDLPSGVIGEDHVEIQRVAVETVPPSWNGELEPTPADNRPLGSREINHLIPLFSFLTPPDLHVFEFDWSPDSNSLAYIAADPPGENNWWVAKLYTQPIKAVAPSSMADTTESGGHVGWEPKPDAILSPSDISGPLHGLQIAVPRWSPDGKSIAFIGGLMSDQGVVGGDVWLISSSAAPPASEPINLTPNRPSSAQWLTWDDNRSLYVSELSGGDDRLIRLEIPTTTTAAKSDEPIFTFHGDFTSIQYESSLSVTSARSLFVFQSSSFNTPPEIFAARAKSLPSTSPNVAALIQLSHFNDAVKPSWGDSVSLNWKNDNFNIQGWLLLPAHYDPAKKYPLLVEIHGGPASSVVSSWDGGAGGFSATAFSSLGYFVLMPNPRGSYGQGEAFTEANRKDFGYGDLRDILAGVDTVLAKYPVDANRVGLAGWSYGGFMTMFAVTQTHRFRAAVAGAGISDWLSYYGENSIDQWMIPYFGASVYDDPAIYAKSSAITFIKQAETPTLTLVGDRDGECPAPQSFEFWHALHDLHVPAQLVVYPNEGHGFSDPADRRDVLERAVDWFARYMPPNP